MLALKKTITALVLSCIFSVTAFADASNGDLLGFSPTVFSYVAANYPALFTGTPQIGTNADYNYAYYPSTGNYIGTSNGNVYISGPAVTGGAIKYYGAISNLMPAITQWQATGTLSLLTGLQGSMGLTGMTGSAGANGSAGAQGTSVPQTLPTGTTGQVLTLLANGNTWVAQNSSAPTPLTIGQQYQGGIIFWLDNTAQHGLIVALSDTAQAVPLSVTDTVAGAYGDGIYAGKANTAMINANNININAGTTAANQSIQFSRQQTGGSCNAQPCFTDWYVPSATELFILHAAVVILNTNLQFTRMSTEYWSSTDQRDQNGPMNSTVNFGVPYAQYSRSRTTSHYVRPIRSF